MEERFWDHVNPEPNTGCWLWDGYLDGRGYGRLGKGGRSGGLIGAHRFSWELCNGSIPEGLSVLHKCAYTYMRQSRTSFHWYPAR